MTRISFALAAAFALVVCACERQPIPGEPLVTHTHGSNGDPRLEGAHAAEHKTDGVHAEPADKKDPHAPPAAAAEQKPTFFPEKK